MSVGRWLRRLTVALAIPASGCATYRVPSEVAYFCPGSRAVLVPENGGGRQAWPAGVFGKEAPEDPTQFPGCKNDAKTERCRVRPPPGYWDRFIYWGEPDITMFRGVVFRLIVVSSHSGWWIIRVNHVGDETLLTVRVVEKFPERDGAYWTWTRLRKLTPAEWESLQRRAEQLNVWTTPEWIPDEAQPKVYYEQSFTLEAYDGEHRRKIGRTPAQTPAFWQLVDAMESYAKCQDARR